MNFCVSPPDTYWACEQLLAHKGSIKNSDELQHVMWQRFVCASRINSSRSSHSIKSSSSWTPLTGSVFERFVPEWQPNALLVVTQEIHVSHRWRNIELRVANQSLSRVFASQCTTWTGRVVTLFRPEKKTNKIKHSNRHAQSGFQ